MAEFEPGLEEGPMPHQRSYSSLGQTSGPAGFNPLSIPHSQTSGYHALSPISPIALGQLQHHGHPQLYTPELLSMGLSQQAMANMIQPLDRQMVFGAYSMEPGVPNGGGMDPVEWERLARSRAAEGQRRMSGRMGYGRHPLDTLGGFGPEASTAWFMPFNMEPPELGHDLGVGMDGLGNMFGGNGVNGVRHGH